MPEKSRSNESVRCVVLSNGITFRGYPMGWGTPVIGGPRRPFCGDTFRHGETPSASPALLDDFSMGVSVPSGGSSRLQNECVRH